MKYIFLFLIFSLNAHSREIALTFDDAPMKSSGHFDTNTRTDELIRKLKSLDIPEVMIFANPCNGDNSALTVAQLKKYVDAGFLIGNHTCSHPRLDDVGFGPYSKDTKNADKLLSSLFRGQKFFRFPFLNESKDEKLRNQTRDWLTAHQYRNGMVSIDNDDYIFSWAINRAKDQGKKIDYKKVEALFLKHIIGAAEFYDDLAVKTLGYSPKHVILLHEMDATVLFIDSLVKELRKNGWKIVSVKEAYQDRLYLEQPKNTYSSNGIIAQLAKEKTGKEIGYNHFKEIKAELKRILDLKK